MADKVFFDTNVLIYAFSSQDPRQSAALTLLLRGGTIGVQTLNEYATVATRKLRVPWPDVINRLDTIQQLCEPAIPLTVKIHQLGIRIAHAYGFQVFDALLLAAALEASCTVFYSEDMQEGQVIEGLTIRNPFRPAPRRR